jgi:hypothetical protein
VLLMTSGTALFDAVAISGTDAGVRVGRGGVASRAGAHMRRVSADGVQGRLQYSWLHRRVQDGGVVWMSDGAVKFKGGNISNTTAVRSLMLRWHVPLCVLQR